MFDNYPPKEYPILLTVTFGKRETGLKDQIKENLNQLPRGIVKYRNSGSYSHSFDCYFKNVDSMRPLINQVLKETEMFISYVSEKDERVFPHDLLKMGNQVMEQKERMR